MAYRKFEDIPTEIQEAMLCEQEKQGNKRNAAVFTNYILANQDEGGFDWLLSDIKNWGFYLTDQISDLEFLRSNSQLLKKQKIMKPYAITRRILFDLKGQFSCSKWEATIDELLALSWNKDNNDIFPVDEKYITLLLEEGTELQKKAVSKYIHLPVDKNAFVRPFASMEISDVSAKLFGDKFILSISSSDKGFEGRSFYLKSDHTVEVVPHNEGHFIRILKK